MDRINSLPDEVLCHILSFLTTKEAALTYVLSRRWRNLLAFVPCLDIDDSVFLHPEEDKWDRPEIIQSFMDFVDRVLALQGNSTIKKFSLKCLTEVDSDRVDGWISNVLARGVSDLDLLIILDMEEDNYRLSSKSFESRTLVKLKIDCGIEIGWLAGSIFLPMLKTLVIDSARVDKFEIFLHALHALEELVLVDVIWKDRDVNVSSASLKTLTITDSDCLGTLSFDTPSLVYFKYSGRVALDYQVVNMKNLFDARIIFLLTDEQIQRAREPDDGDGFDLDIALGYSNVWKLFQGIQNVLNLYLSADTLEVLSQCCESMPVFNNLKSLAIKSDTDRGWQAMPVLLRNCPHLKTLVIEGLLHHVTDKCGDVFDCISQEDKEMEISVEENDSTELIIPEVSNVILQMMEDYNKLSSCNVQFLATPTFQGRYLGLGNRLTRSASSGTESHTECLQQLMDLIQEKDSRIKALETTINELKSHLESKNKFIEAVHQKFGDQFDF